jgi:hypothetical protein
MTDSDYIDLGKLPEDHPMLDQLLVEIRAEYKKHAWPEWRPVLPGEGKFDGKTYNQLDGAWVQAYYLWRAPK